MGLDAIEMRKRNHIRPDEMPFKTASATVYDSGEFSVLLDKALAQADVRGFAGRKEESRKRGKLRGLGIGNYLEVTAPPMKEMGGIRFEENGDVTIITGTLDYGQGHWTPFAQVLSDRLGIPFHKIKLIQGDSDLLIAGGGTGGSKSIMASGAAIVEASIKVVDKGKQIAGVALEASAEDIEFKAGRFIIVGTDRGIGILELAEKLRERIAQTNFIPDDPLSITASFGVAASHADQNFEDAFRQADEALYLAKSRGRNCVVAAADDQMHKMTGARKSTWALVSGRFKLHK